VPWRARDVRPLLLRRWVGRPQLRRDPLGSGNMFQRYAAIIALAGAVALPLPTWNTRAQNGCRTDSARAALADSLLQSAAEEFEDPGSRGSSSIYAKVRRAVEVAPLNMDRWRVIRQFARFLNRPDTAVALATVALKRWPSCAVGDTALVEARALKAQQRPPH